MCMKNIVTIDASIVVSCKLYSLQLRIALIKSVFKNEVRNDITKPRPRLVVVYGVKCMINIVDYNCLSFIKSMTVK